jgi:ribosomal protein S4E
MEVEREKEKSYRMFCEKHRPLKIVKEMEEKDKLTIDEIFRFCKIIDKCMEVDQKAQLK